MSRPSGAGLRLAAGLVAVFVVSAARADASDLPPYDPAFAVEIPSIGPFYGVRLRGLGGAYTAVAEGPEGTLTSLASLANRRPHEAGHFHWSGTLSWAFPAGDMDIGNNGRAAPTGFNLLAGGFTLRFGQLGLGVFIESLGITDRGVTGREVRVNRAVVGAAYALHGDEWIIGAGLHSVGYRLEEPGRPPVDTSKPHLGMDLLWRPLFETYRVGASFKAPGWADLPNDEGVSMPPAVARPWEASLGGAIWLGDGPLNLPLPTSDDMVLYPPSRVGMLLSLDLFLMGPPPDRGIPVAGLEAYFEDRLQLVKERPSFGVRVGGETEIANRVRLRGGFWLEPSRFEEVRPRIHWTGGFDVRLFRFFSYQIRSSLVFDLASQYRVGGVSLGFW